MDIENLNIEAAHRALIDFMKRNDFPRPHPPKPHSVEEAEAIVAAALTPRATDQMGECDVTDCDRPATECSVGEAGDLWLCRKHAALTPGDPE